MKWMVKIKAPLVLLADDEVENYRIKYFKIHCIGTVGFVDVFGKKDIYRNVRRRNKTP